MATKICDVKACDKLRKAYRQFFAPDPNYDPEKGALLAVMRKRIPQKTVVVTEVVNLKYCPFCGTRVSLSLIDTLEEELVSPKIPLRA